MGRLIGYARSVRRSKTSGCSLRHYGRGAADPTFFAITASGARTARPGLRRVSTPSRRGHASGLAARPPGRSMTHLGDLD